MKKIRTAILFKLYLVFGLCSGPLIAATPQRDNRPTNNVQDVPGAWEFRPPRDVRGTNINQGNFPRQNTQFQYSYRNSWPGPQASFYGQRPTQPYAQPQTQPYGQPQTQPYAQPQTQPYGQPQTQPYAQSLTQPYGQPRTQPYAPPLTQRYGQPRTQPYAPPQTQPYRQPQTQPFSESRQPQQRLAPHYRAQQTAKPPRIEAFLSNDEPYAQEAAIYTLKVVSDTNIATIDVSPPKSDDAIFRKLDGPLSRARSRRGQQEIVNEFHYTLTPLRAGRIELPPMRITGSMAPTQNSYLSGRGQTFDVKTDRGLYLKVKPSNAAVRPWLPLQHLALQAGMEGDEKIKTGKPMTLWIEMSAVGATGAQLPSLESQLQSPDFRVYREKTQTSGELSKNGRYLKGVRKEYFTLVPQHGGELRLPPVRIAWWDVKTGTKQYASLPIRSLRADGGGLFGTGLLRGNDTATLFPAGSPSVFWIPLAAVFGLILGYWFAVWLRGKNREPGQRTPFSPFARLHIPAGWIGPTVHRLKSGPIALLRRVTRPLSRYWNKLLEQLVFALPRSLRFWFCLRCVDQEADPKNWGQMLKLQAGRHLHMSPQSPLPEIAEKIIEIQPKRDIARLRVLMHELDGAVYGGESLDFERWKKEFKHQIRPNIASLFGGIKTRPRQQLPILNPNVA